LLDRSRATDIVNATPKLGDYSLAIVNLGPTRRLRVIVDAKADWMQRAFSVFSGKPIAEADQNSIRAFLDSLRGDAGVKLAGALLAARRAYAVEMRPIVRDGDAYYLDELVASGQFPDLAIALIGQVLLENYCKKESRIAIVRREGAKSAEFGLLVLNANPDVFIPGICVNSRCGLGTTVEAASIEVFASESFAPPPEEKGFRRFSLFDYRGQAHEINVLGRSPTERMVRADQALFEAAGRDDLVPLEVYFMGMYFSG
jgi:hypothetical protein